VTGAAWSRTGRRHPRCRWPGLRPESRATPHSNVINERIKVLAFIDASAVFANVHGHRFAGSGIGGLRVNRGRGVVAAQERIRGREGPNVDQLTVDISAGPGRAAATPIEHHDDMAQTLVAKVPPGLS